MSIYRRGQTFFVYVPKRSGGRAVRTTGTTDRQTARNMDEMIRRLSARREWDFIEAIHNERLSVAELYDADASNGLDDLRARLSDVDLRDFIVGWLDGVRTRTSPSSDTAEHYASAVRTLIGDERPFHLSELSYSRISTWLATRPVSSSTRRKYHAALSSFSQHLVALGVLAENPVRSVRPPKARPPRTEYLSSISEALRLADAQPEPFRTISVLLHATGMEISVALNLKRRDIDAGSREVRARGTKTHSRDRVALISNWAWPIIAEHIKNLLPEAPLFPGIDRYRAGDVHRAAAKAIGRLGYRQHDARHSFAVWAIRSGASFEFVARQLGHASIAMVVSTYGRYRPTATENRAWEQRLEELEKSRSLAM